MKAEWSESKRLESKRPESIRPESKRPESKRSESIRPQSIWSETTKIPGRNPLPGDRKTEVAVIGAGLFGVLAAHYLKEQGKEVIVLEADRIGSGQTRGTTAKITSQHNLIYQKLTKTMGERYAVSYAKANQQAIKEYERLIRKNHIACHFEKKDAYLFSVNESEILRREADCAARCGIPASFVRETELPFPVHGAVRFTDQAQFQPLEFLEAVSGGLTIYERTPVKEVRGNEVITGRGVVRADHIVFACHFPFVNIPGFYFMRMYQDKSYVMALGPVKELEGMYLGIDKNSYSFRSAGDTLLLGHGSHRTGKCPKKNPYEEMRRFQEHFYPGTREYGRWSAEDCMSVDGVPYIGRFSGVISNWYVATGFGKWGMTSSMAAARIVAAQIAGKRLPYEEVFTPQRFRLKASAAALLSHAGESAAGLTKGALPGDLRCPHLGCRLVYNRADGCYECPCHGSQFSRDGNIFAGPAQESLPFID